MSDLTIAAASYRQTKSSRDNRLVRYTQGFLIFFLLTLTLTSASIQNYLSGNLQTLLGSDMVLAQYQPLQAEQIAKLHSEADKVSTTSVVPISITFKEVWQRVQLKLVDNNYPLQGELTISQTKGGVAQATQSRPAIGEIWIDSRAASSLGVTIGDYIKIAETQLTLTAFVQHEPDRLMEGHNVEMRALALAESFNSNPLPDDGKKFRYLINASESGRTAINSWAKESLPDAQLLDRHSGQHPLAAYWKRVENFLGLASVLLFFMAAIAINMAGRRQIEQQKQRLALYLSMGLPLTRGLRLSIFEWIMGFASALIPSVLLAYAAQSLLMLELQAQFAGITSGLHLTAISKSLALVFLLLICTQIPSFIQLKNTSVVSLIRQQPQSGFAAWQALWSFITLSILATAYSDNWLLTAMTLVTMAVTLLLMVVVNWMVLTVGERWGRLKPGILPFAFFIMKQRLLNKSVQVAGLGLCATLLLFTLMLMKDIGNAMHNQTRAHNGNLMISDARESQMQDLTQWANATGSIIKDMSPYTHASVVRVNDLPLQQFISQPSGTSSRLERPIRLSWSQQIPDNNYVIDGSWWQPEDSNWQQLSVEEEVMTDLGLSFGDKVTFSIAGKLAEFKVVSKHGFQSGGSSVTFWFKVPQRALNHLTVSQHYMGSMELPDSAWPKLGGLLQQHPTLSVSSLQELTARFDQILAMVTKATVGFSAMILLLSLIVIVASVSGFEADDRKRNGLLRSMGLQASDCVRLSFYEWLVTGLIAAVGAVTGTWVAGQLIYESQFSMNYQPDYLFSAATLAIACTLVCSVGMYFCRSSLKVSVRQLMADA